MSLSWYGNFFHGYLVFWSSTCKTDFLAGNFFRFSMYGSFHLERGGGLRNCFGEEGECGKCFGRPVSVLGGSQVICESQHGESICEYGMGETHGGNGVTG